MWTDWGKKHARNIWMDLHISLLLDVNIKESNKEIRFRATPFGTDKIQLPYYPEMHID